MNEWMNEWRNKNFNENHTHSIKQCTTNMDNPPWWYNSYTPTFFTGLSTQQDIQYNLVNLRTIVNLQTTESVFKFWWNGFKILVLFEQKKIKKFLK